MKSIEIKGTLRKEVGKKSSRDLRKEGRVPCVLYGGENVIHFSVEGKAMKNLVYTPNSYIVNIGIDKKKYEGIMKSIQFHAVTDEIEHIDFLQIAADKKIIISVPVKLNGSSEGVKQGGKLALKLRSLKAKGYAKDFPDTLDIDVTELSLGKSIKVGELTFDKLELLDPKNAVVTTVKLTRSAVSAAKAVTE